MHTRSLIRKYVRAPMGVTTLDAAIPQSTGPTTLEAMASALARPPSVANPCAKGKHLVIPTRGARAGIPVCRGPAPAKKRTAAAASKASKASKKTAAAKKAAKVAKVAKKAASKAAKKARAAIKKAKAAKRAAK